MNSLFYHGLYAKAGAGNADLRKLLRASNDLFETGKIQAIGSTSLAYRVVSRNYAKRIGDTHESVKTTALVDCDTGAFLDVHCSMSFPHNTQIAWQVLKRNLSNLGTVVGDKCKTRVLNLALAHPPILRQVRFHYIL
jgi:hypothetical protein